MTQREWKKRIYIVHNCTIKWNYKIPQIVKTEGFRVYDLYFEEVSNSSSKFILLFSIYFFTDNECLVPSNAGTSRTYVQRYRKEKKKKKWRIIKAGRIVVGTRNDQQRFGSWQVTDKKVEGNPNSQPYPSAQSALHTAINDNDIRYW